MALVAEAVVADPAPAGVVIEQVEYDPYGRVRRTAIADFDHSGVVEVPDIFALLSARAATSPSADYDWDGDADVPDYFAFLSVWFAEGVGTTARDQLSSPSIDNPIGYCGYYHDRETVGIMGAGNGGLYQVRHRVYDPHAGRWLQRDPAGFVDGMNLYEYVRGRVAKFMDAFGLSCGDQEAVGPPEPTFWDRAKQTVHDAMQALSNNVADSELPDAAKEVLYFTYGAIETATTYVIVSSEEATTKSPAERIVDQVVEVVEDAVEREENHADRAGRDFSALSAFHEYLANQSGANDLAAAIFGYDSVEDREMTAEERVAAGLRGGGTTTLICVGCARATKSGQRPPNHTPDGAGRRGAFRQAKRDAGIPVSQEPIEQRLVKDRTNPGRYVREYEYEVPAPGGGRRRIIIRDDRNGHRYPDDPTHDRGPHFNGPSPDNRHYDY